MTSRALQQFNRLGLRDYVIPLLTPFKQDLELDEEGLRHNVRRVIKSPACGGIYVGSVYQEFWSLTLAERMRLQELVVHETSGAVPVVAGATSTNIKDTLALAAHAAAVGANMVMIWPPIFGPRDDGGVLAFYEAVLPRVEFPVCVYSTTLSELGYYLNPDLLTRLVDHPNVVAVKEASFSITTYLSVVRALGDRIAVSTPFEEYWMAAAMTVPDKCPEFLMGSSRAMYMQNDEHPYLARFLEEVRAGRPQAAYDILSSLEPLIKGIQMQSFAGGKHPIAVVKYATELLGLRGGPVRPPTSAMSEHDRELVRSLMAAVGLVGTELPVH